MDCRRRTGFDRLRDAHDAKDESEGLDYSVHGETAFDFGLATEAVVGEGEPEPRSAVVPPAVGDRFTVVVEGTTNGELMHVWSDLCKADGGPPSGEFLGVYPHVTTVQGNRFLFRGGDQNAMRDNLQRLFQSRVNSSVRAKVEN